MKKYGATAQDTELCEELKGRIFVRRIIFIKAALMMTKWPTKDTPGQIMSGPMVNSAIIGDSNLVRIPNFFHSNCQTESYSCAQINNMVHLLLIS